MKILVATDIHGSLPCAEKIVKAFEHEGADSLMLLGDLYYHGPRNPLPDGYAPMKVSELFNKISEKVTAVRGNCDADIDLTISDFIFHNETCVRVCGRDILFTHGDKHNKEILPDMPTGSIMIYGHFHINEVTEREGITCINIASVSLPKNDCAPAYAVIDDKEVFLKALSDGHILYNISL